MPSLLTVYRPPANGRVKASFSLKTFTRKNNRHTTLLYLRRFRDGWLRAPAFGSIYQRGFDPFTGDVDAKGEKVPFVRSCTYAARHNVS
ncbi:hypothetical protein EVAR_64795_1 [Eumeta japonica]|uniref:Uncharacterized protein n=1 Tax=Eumeta variegata TaxID=151549 RepID=A0A4C1ZS75_EUMVA|nr:hypothetical protein EVAR_64795_1 [Eumeta japonica]